MRSGCSQDRIRSGNVYDDYNEMLKRDDIDVVDILVPIEENFEAASAVLKAGKNLIAEKPLASFMEGAKTVDLYHSGSSLVMLAETIDIMMKTILSRYDVQGRIGEGLLYLQ